jgi:hypothetical protein
VAARIAALAIGSFIGFFAGLAVSAAFGWSWTTSDASIVVFTIAGCFGALAGGLIGTYVWPLASLSLRSMVTAMAGFAIGIAVIQTAPEGNMILVLCAPSICFVVFFGILLQLEPWDVLVVVANGLLYAFYASLLFWPRDKRLVALILVLALLHSGCAALVYWIATSLSHT